MAIKADIGISEKIDPFEAGYNACVQARKNIVDPKVIVIFASARFNLPALFSGAEKAAPDVPIIGCSSAAEITSFGPIRGAAVAMAIGGRGFGVTTGQGGLAQANPRMAGARLGQNLAKAAGTSRGYFLFADILNSDGQDLLSGFREGIGAQGQVVGAAASDDYNFQEVFIYGHNASVAVGLSGLALKGDCQIGMGVRQGWQPIGLPVKITKAMGTVVEEIAGRPAVDFYVDNFGIAKEKLLQSVFAQLAIIYPLGLIMPESGEALTRYPLAILPRGAIRFTAALPEGSDVKLMLGSREDALKAAEEAAVEACACLGRNKPKAAFVFSSIARSKLLSQNGKKEIERIKAVIGEDVPIIGFYSFAEFAQAVSAPAGRGFYNESIVVAVISEQR